MNFKIVKAAAFASVLLATVQTAQANVPAVRGDVLMQTAATAPLGMMKFCDAYASQCRPDSVGKVTLTDELLALLQSVNSRVNGSIRYASDVPGRDRWTLNPSSGDCEDYALTKRAQLIRAGVPAGALRIATTKTRRGEPHAILVVKTSRGDYVLDNLAANIRTLGSSGYRIRTISTSNPMVWAG